MADKGAEFEDWVREAYEALLKGQGVPAVVSSRVSIEDTHGIRRNFDVMYEFPLAGINHRVVIECKNWARNVDIGKIADFYGKFKSVENTIGIIVSVSELQDGAARYAEARRIKVIKPNQLPDIFTITRDKIAQELSATGLPDEYAKSEPFFIIMETNAGNVTGSWHALRTSSGIMFPIFINRNDALLYIENNELKESYAVRGAKSLLIRVMKMAGGHMGVDSFILLLRPEPTGSLVSMPISFEYIEEFLH